MNASPQTPVMSMRTKRSSLYHSVTSASGVYGFNGGRARLSLDSLIKTARLRKFATGGLRQARLRRVLTDQARRRCDSACALPGKAQIAFDYQAMGRCGAFSFD